MSKSKKDLDAIDKVKKDLTAPKAKKTRIKSKDLLSSGCTLLNLQITGRSTGAFPKGRPVNIVGDSESGKTWLAMTALAEAANSPNFEDYKLVYMDVEGGASMDIESYFGKKLAKRIHWENPSTVEEMYDLLDDLNEAGEPFIAVVDSMDGLTDESEVEQVKKEKDARQKGKETSGSYGTNKAKINSARLRVVSNKIKETGSIVIILSQTRTNIGFTARFDPKTMAGGLALKFYSRVQLWLSVKGFIKTKIKGKDRPIGAVTIVKVKKNQVTGKKGAVKFTFYHSHGIDDTGSMIDYLFEEGHWKKKAGNIDAVGLADDVRLNKEKLVQYIEDNNLVSELRRIVSGVWNEIEDACVVRRKNRYE